MNLTKEILLGNVAFAAHAVRRSTACPNQYWEPVLNEDGTQQLTEGIHIKFVVNILNTLNQLKMEAL